MGKKHWNFDHIDTYFDLKEHGIAINDRQLKVAELSLNPFSNIDPIWLDFERGTSFYNDGDQITLTFSPEQAKQFGEKLIEFANKIENKRLK